MLEYEYVCVCDSSTGTCNMQESGRQKHFTEQADRILKKEKDIPAG